MKDSAFLLLLCCPTPIPPDLLRRVVRRAKMQSEISWLIIVGTAHPQAGEQTVETVEKVPFQKMIIEKWDGNTEKRLFFCVLSNILAIFEPVVGDFYEHFSN